MNEIETKKVTFRKRGKAHRGLIMNGRLVATCGCPGSQRGTLTNGAQLICEGWEKSNCKN